MGTKPSTTETITVLYPHYDSSHSVGSSHYPSVPTVKTQPNPVKSLNEPGSLEEFDILLETDETDGDVKWSNEVLGKGGMGIIYRGKQKYPNRPIAIKRLRVRSPQLEKALFKEAMITGKLSHPNIIPIHLLYPNGSEGPEVVMPCVHGESLLKRISENSIELKEALNVIIQVGHAVHYAHDHGVIHRDIKPENIMIGEYGEVYLLDWGVALDREHPSGSQFGFVGTPAYMAPEMFSGDPDLIDHRTDVYLMGATLHHILTQKPRHTGETIQEAMAEGKKSEPYPYGSDIFSELAELCNRTCEADPKKRPQSIRAFQEDLRTCIHHWELLDLIHNGEEALEALKNAEDAKDGYPHFMRARVSFEQALRSWPESRSIWLHLMETIEEMLQKLLEAEQYQTAGTLLKDLLIYNPQHNKKDLYQKKIYEQKNKRNRIEKKAMESDLSVSRKIRTQIAFLLTVLAIFQVSYVSVQRLIFEESNNYTLLFLTMFIPMCVTGLLFLLVGKKLLHNKASRSVGMNIFATIALMFANRVVGIINEENIDSIITVDVFIMTLFWMHMSVSTPKAIPFLVTLFLAGCISAWEPSTAFWMMNIGAIITGCASVWLWAKEELD
ncbi:MAG: serine/threonine-protein kinase [Myxococcota bacterium]|nr:serine/threonine-protein kinase [Myxococcota bacterium]